MKKEINEFLSRDRFSDSSDSDSDEEFDLIYTHNDEHCDNFVFDDLIR